MSEAVPTPRGDLDAAFDSLVDVAQRLADHGRAPRSASVKAALQLATDPPFDEERFGFLNFRSFLRAAADAGRIELRPAPVGPDVDVVPCGAVSQATPAVSGRIRRDVWDAFTRWDEGFVRSWDKEIQRAFRLPSRVTPGESQETSALRLARISNPARFIPIEHAPPSSVVSWAREFAQGLPADASRSALLAALEDDLPIHNFTQLVRRLGLGARWHDTHLARVRSLVENWARDNGLEIDLRPEAEPNTSIDPPPVTDVAVRGVDPVPSEHALRARVHRMVDRMTLPELLSLSVPLRLSVPGE
jgi:hypothetical protein